MARKRYGAFTLIEILIVVVILGILAAIVIPNVSGAAMQTKQSVLRTMLKQTNAQLQLFRQRHGIAPGTDPSSGNVSESVLVAQLTSYVDAEGNTSSTRTGGFVYGPYFNEFPVNPFNARRSVLLVADGANIPDGDSTTGWIYKPETLEFYPNLTKPEYGGQQ